MDNPEADRIAETLRTAMEAQGMNGADLAREIERLTGQRPNDMLVSRWRNAHTPLIRISPDLATICTALQLDPVEVARDAIRAPLAELPATNATGGE